MELLLSNREVTQPIFAFVSFMVLFAIPVYIILDRPPGEKYFFQRGRKKDQKTFNLIDLS